MTVQIVLVSVLVTIVYTLGTYGQTSDVEIWNGFVESKERDHGHYLRSYSCNCRTVSCGKDCTTTKCDTCYEDRYTVTWSAETTVGNVRFDHKDSSWRSVYNSPDPSAYTRCVAGEPAAREHSYTNYVQAVPESLFHDDSAIETYKEQVPEYPRVYDFYRINRIVGDASGIPEAKLLNDGLNNELKLLGSKKQVNIVVILTEIDDPSFRYAVEREWLGGEKNDVVIFLGVDGKKITWVDVMTWALNSGNELFHVTMRDGLYKIGHIDPEKMVPLISKTITDLYDRPQMADFEYLEDAIDPPTWVIILAVIIAIGGSIGLTFLFHHYELDDIIGEVFKRRRY